MWHYGCHISKMLIMESEKAQTEKEIATNMFGGLGCSYLRHIEILASWAWKRNYLIGHLIKIYTTVSVLGSVVIGLFPGKMGEEHPLILQWNKVRTLKGKSGWQIYRSHQQHLPYPLLSANHWAKNWSSDKEQYIYGSCYVKFKVNWN